MESSPEGHPNWLEAWWKLETRKRHFQSPLAPRPPWSGVAPRDGASWWLLHNQIATEGW